MRLLRHDGGGFYYLLTGVLGNYPSTGGSHSSPFTVTAAWEGRVDLTQSTQPTWKSGRDETIFFGQNSNRAFETNVVAKGKLLATGDNRVIRPKTDPSLR